jgi:hypothetical protein
MTPTFLNPPTHYTVSEFRAMLARLPLGEWLPRFPTLHNTGVPSLKQWLGMGATPQERWGGNLNRYYQGMGWHAGPHLVVCPDYVWALCDLTKSGVSVSCWNSETFGIEMVGNYEVGGDDFASGEGAKVRDNAAVVLAALSEKFAWGDLSDFVSGERGLHFHHDCARDHHACPGSKVSKPDMLARVESLRGAAPAAPVASAPPPLQTAHEDHEAQPKILSVDDIQAALNRLGAHPPLAVDGDCGPATVAAVKSFQAGHHCFVDGWVGVETRGAIEAALAHAE